MGKRQRRRRPATAPATSDYRDAEGNVLTLRDSLSAGTVAKLREPLDRVFERFVLERSDLAAAVADDVMMVLASGMGRLVARCRPNLESVNEPHPREQVERPVDARDANQPPLRAQAVEDLLRRQTAVLVREQLKHSRAGAA